MSWRIRRAKRIRYMPVGKDKEAVMLSPIHTANHRGIVCIADFDRLQNVIGTSEPLEPDDTMELDFAPLVQLHKGLEGEVARISLFGRVISRSRIFSHTRDPSDPVRDTQQNEHRF